MFFCHAIEHHRRELEAQGKWEELQNLPAVTVLEQSASPGGVWKASDASDDGDSPNMYAGLWTNGPTPSLEFFDYTFDEHFGRPMYSCLPRQLVLDYMLGRVTSKCSEFFDKYFEFETKVDHVIWDDQANQFRVTCTKGEKGGDVTTTTRFFDKCVWAAGQNGKPHVPKALKQQFLDGKFPGRLIHSTETHNLKEDVCNKRVLMIGAGLSAEDLALMAIKLGVEQVYITCRDVPEDYEEVERWPYDKVEVLHGTTVHSVKGNNVQFIRCNAVWSTGYIADEIPTPDNTRTLEGIDTVIFCTGYIEGYVG